MTEVVAAFIGAIAAIAVYYLSSRDLKRKDRESKKREIRLQFLIEAYRQLESNANRSPEETWESVKKIESAISDIQLFGTRRQVGLAQDVAAKFAAGGEVLFNELLDELRRDLRSELALEPLPEGRKVLRFTKLGSEQDGPANGSQPIRSETNRTSPSAGSRR